jgi:hypothetical protein
MQRYFPVAQLLIIIHAQDESDKKSTKEEEETKEVVVKPRCLHKTASIFLRNLAPTITKQEVEAVIILLHIKFSVSNGFFIADVQTVSWLSKSCYCRPAA